MHLGRFSEVSTKPDHILIGFSREHQAFAEAFADRQLLDICIEQFRI
jgi:hypothetical protein